MEKKRRISSIVNIVLVVTLIAALSLASWYKLLRFYVNNEKYNNQTTDLGNRFENDVNTTFAFKTQFIELNGAICTLLGQREMNGVVKMNNGSLITPYREISENILINDAKNVIKLKNYCEERGIKFLYCIPLSNYSKYDPQLPEGFSDYSNLNFDRFMKVIREGGVDVIDIREEMHNDGIDQYEMMYKTDHHWNTEAGFYAYTKITEYLEDKLDCEVDPVVKDINSYTITTYPEAHLGTRGKRVGTIFGGIDDFNLYLPKFETSITRSGKSGSFEEIVVDMTALNDPDLMNLSTYDVTLGNSRSTFMNANAKNDKTILLMADSYASVVSPFMILSYANMNCMKMGLSDKVIDKVNPDAIVMFYYNICFQQDGYFEFDLPVIDIPLPKINVTLENGGTEARITWDAVENAKEYKVYTELDGKLTMQAKITETEYTVTGLDSSKDYGFVVVGKNGDDESKYSRSKDIVYVEKD